MATRGALKWFGDEEEVGVTEETGVGVREEEEGRGVREEEEEEGRGVREEVEGAGTPLLRGGDDEVGGAVLWGWLSVGFGEELWGRVMTERRTGGGKGEKGRGSGSTTFATRTGLSTLQGGEMLDMRYKVMVTKKFPLKNDRAIEILRSVSVSLYRYPLFLNFYCMGNLTCNVEKMVKERCKKTLKERCGERWGEAASKELRTYV